MYRVYPLPAKQLCLPRYTSTDAHRVEEEVMVKKKVATEKAAPKKATKTAAKKPAPKKAVPKAAPQVYSLEIANGNGAATWSFSTEATRDGALVKLKRRATCISPVSTMRPLRFATTSGEKTACYVKYAVAK
jgi:hypothetical protein